MRTQHLLGTALALGIAGALVLPSRTDAYTLIGGSLGTSQRDFRVFNNFTDAAANNNNVADANFPGWQGATMAIWKGSVEWGSRLHANGNGDPTQVGGLGSGGANFDALFTGAANQVGGTNDNIHSEIAGSDGGVLAYTETPISDGWRIRYYQGWTWEDGPGVVGGNVIDLQGVACHEYGHALGLGHSADNAATMYPSIGFDNGESGRSIAADDIAGVQAIYGVASASKPIITSVVSNPGQVVINGSGFTASANEVWFTKSGINANGEPTKVTNLTSNGTTITAAVPADAGDGDLLVKISGTGNNKLSNAWPFDENTGPPCNPPFNSCLTSPNSVGPGAVMGYAGTQSVANNDLVLLSSGCPPNAAGIFYFGSSETFAAFGNGFRCIASPTIRLGIINANEFGDAVYNLNLNAPPVQGNISSGQTKYFQFWYRNPAGGGAGFNLSDSLGVPFCP